MSQVVEQVAKAISLGEWYEGDSYHARRVRSVWLERAMAAIRAMREPTTQMTDAAALADHDGYDNDAAGVYTEMWEAMIDAVLEDAGK